MKKSVRNTGDPVPFVPPVPDIPFLIDSFYHVGFGVTLPNFRKEISFESTWTSLPSLAKKLIRLGEVVISPVSEFNFVHKLFSKLSFFVQLKRVLMLFLKLK